MSPPLWVGQSQPLAIYFPASLLHSCPIGDRLLTYIEKNPIIKTHKDVVILIRKINTIAKFHLLSTMEKVISRPNDPVDQLTNPNYDILIKCFSQYKRPVTEAKKYNIDSYFFYNNIMRFSTENLESMPEVLNRVKMKKGDKIIDVSNLTSTHNSRKENYEWKVAKERTLILEGI